MKKPGSPKLHKTLAFAATLAALGACVGANAEPARAAPAAAKPQQRGESYAPFILAEAGAATKQPEYKQGKSALTRRTVKAWGSKQEKMRAANAGATQWKSSLGQGARGGAGAIGAAQYKETPLRQAGASQSKDARGHEAIGGSGAIGATQFKFDQGAKQGVGEGGVRTGGQ